MELTPIPVSRLKRQYLSFLSNGFVNGASKANTKGRRKSPATLESSNLETANVSAEVLAQADRVYLKAYPSVAGDQARS